MSPMNTAFRRQNMMMKISSNAADASASLILSLCIVIVLHIRFYVHGLYVDP